MPFCPQCGVDNPDAARYCDQCGAMLVPAPRAATPAAAPSTAPVVSGSVICPQCGTAAIPGEAFCDNCGAPLSAASQPTAPVVPPATPPYSSTTPPQPIYPPPQPVAPPASYQPPVVAQPITPAASYRATLATGRLAVIATGTVLALPAGMQAIIGRGDPVSNYFPDIDLTPHGALDNGVGRRHCRIFIQGGQVMIEDLDSTNGTTVGGQRLTARRPHPLRPGDRVVLGQLELQYSEV
ncbi:MAG TPA: zinc ribbon domain-containing protein [Roseiflexaceae bacterium]|nr:zinc ribbon domain-containing protein [Roseiflexaceae bacterium]HMP41553.1 zinc ribbon domain-containing protein [Roseiflexaceae bacterium]